MKRKHTAGKWQAKAEPWPIYFIATHPDQMRRTMYRHVLVAVNELTSELDNAALDLMAIRQGRDVLLDSGVFALAMDHARAHGVTHNEALGLAPDAIDGFDDLFKTYCETIERLEGYLWGYVEIDQGGRENKIKTRTRLEKLGLRPIPVYHPLNDGWDYFDYLAQRYDRICFGNVVNADPQTRKRLVATAWERRRKHPDVWIHLLGLTPSQLTVAFPCNSCDSSTWIGSLRWARLPVFSATGKFGELGLEFIYEYTERSTTPGVWSPSYLKAMDLCAYETEMVRRTMLTIAKEQKEILGADIGMFQ